MIQSISRTAVPTKEGYLEIRGRKYDDSREIEHMREVFEIPDKPYRVTYKLNPQGDYKVNSYNGPSIARVCGGLGSRIVCFIPPEWVGKRVSREVRVL